MMNDGFKRPALGQSASLGTLYDARTDCFLPVSLLNNILPETAIVRINGSGSDAEILDKHSIKARFDKLGINADLGASILAGTLSPQGSGGFLSDTATSNFIVQRSLHHVATALHEKLNFASGDLRQYITADALLQTQATHVVTEITWGSRSIITAKYSRNTTEDERDVERRLEEELKIIGSQLHGNNRTPTPLRVDGMFGISEHSQRKDMGKALEITIYADDVPTGQPVAADLRVAYDFISNVPVYISSTNGGRGQPISYTLLPVQWLSMIIAADLGANNTITQPNTDILVDCLTVFDELRDARKILLDYQSYINFQHSLVPAAHHQTVADHVDRAKEAQETLKQKFATTLQSIRRGQADSKRLMVLLDEVRQGPLSPAELLSVADYYTKKLAFLNMAAAQGAQYITDESQVRMPKGNVYTLYLTRDTVADDPLWNENASVIMQMLNERGGKKTIRIVDCDVQGRVLQSSYVVFHRDGQLITDDLRKLHNFLSDKCLMRFEERHLDSWGVEKPLDRKPCKVVCPGKDCDPRQHPQWICSRCYAPIDYGSKDQYFYCDCGRTTFRHWTYKCNSSNHGPNFEKHDARRLIMLLDQLEGYEEVNLLILGETGVGKSTFINAFVNYLTYGSLDDAVHAPGIEHVIPCSFATQAIDEDDAQKRLVQTQIKIGATEEEADGSRGQSATQKTLTYPIFVGNTMVRLIDTPGIGDTRGIEQDAKNMADVLSVLRNYKELHGILILLKPNNSRLNVMFKFCIKELLTHLHRNAALNMVFGFTNTRGSNYYPGDTFKPLEALLSEYRDVNLGLFHDTVYCFDSESFRYLAAYKQGVNLGSFDDYYRSWEQSATEARRLLDYVRSLVPHQVKNTLSLNETRHMILQLTKPMAEIAQKINDTIELNERDNELLRNSNLSKKDMLNRLNIQQNSVTFTAVDKPKTVCTNSACIEKVEQVGPNGEDTIHKSLCHNPCCLKNVPVEKVGTPELIKCWAFNGTERCKPCGHHWKEHKHILYEASNTSRTIKDPKVEALLADNAKITTVIEAAIKAKAETIAEFKHEHAEIQKAAVQFSIWLKHHSITPYNDATLEYLEHLINEEKSKVHIGASRQRLDAFEQYRREYEELVKVFETNLDQGRGQELLDSQGVDRIIKSLYGLKHYGNDLRKLRDVVAFAHAATYRERPYRVKASRGYGTSGSWDAGSSGRWQAGASGITLEKTSSFGEKSQGYGDRRGNMLRKQRPSTREDMDHFSMISGGSGGGMGMYGHMSGHAPPSYFEAASSSMRELPFIRSGRNRRSLGGRISDKMNSIFR